MTKEALQEQHKMIMALTTKSSTDATNLSIQYAIEVLEELDNDKEVFSDGRDEIVLPLAVIKSRITELRNLIK